MNSQQWEYYAMPVAAGTPAKYLDELGKDGWELVCSLTDIGTVYQLIFKRPLVAENTAGTPPA